MISHNKELMFSGELCTQETHIPWTAFLSYPNSNAPLHPLACLSLPFWKAKVLFSCRAAADVTGFPSPPTSGPGKHWWDQPWPACAHQRVPATLLLAMGLTGTHPITLKLQPGGTGNIHPVLYTLSTLFLNMCKKTPLLYLSRKKIHCYLWHLSPHFFHTFLCPVVVIAAVTEMHKIMQLSSILI